MFLCRDGFNNKLAKRQNDPFWQLLSFFPKSDEKTPSIKGNPNYFSTLSENQY